MSSTPPEESSFGVVTEESTLAIRTPEEFTFDQCSPVDSLPLDSILLDPPKGFSGRGSSSKGSSPRGASPRGASPKGSIPKASTAEGSIPKESAPEETAPKESTSKGCIPKASTSKGSIPKESAPEGCIFKASTSKESAPEETAPKEPTLQESAPEPSIVPESISGLPIFRTTIRAPHLLPESLPEDPPQYQDVPRANQRYHQVMLVGNENDFIPYGLTPVELQRLGPLRTYDGYPPSNEVVVRGPTIVAISSLGHMGYHVVASTRKKGSNNIIWVLEKVIDDDIFKPPLKPTEILFSV